MGPRERILAKIRKQQSRVGPAPSAAETQFSEAYLKRRARGPLPKVAERLAERYTEATQLAADMSDEVLQRRRRTPR